MHPNFCEKKDGTLYENKQVSEKYAHVRTPFSSWAHTRTLVMVQAYAHDKNRNSWHFVKKNTEPHFSKMRLKAVRSLS